MKKLSAIVVAMMLVIGVIAAGAEDFKWGMTQEEVVDILGETSLI